MDINKIRDNQLTEDEKMELIADYLENGGGSKNLRVKVKTNYIPTMASEIIDLSSITPFRGYGYMVQEGVTFEDEDGHPVSLEDILAAVKAGTLEFTEFQHLGGHVFARDKDAIEFQDGILKTSRLQPDLAYMADPETGAIAIASITGEMVGLDDGGATTPWAYGILIQVATSVVNAIVGVTKSY